jgi:hypothetical protein
LTCSNYFCNKIVLHQKDEALLKLIKAFFGVGNISKRDDYIEYVVTSVKDILIIVNHFSKYPLVTQKKADYELFKQAYNLVSRKEHLTAEGLGKIVSIRASMNNGLSDELQIFGVIPVPRPTVKLPENLDPHWLAGFVSAEGCFMIKCNKNLTCKSGFQVLLRFQITQHIRDEELLRSLMSYFGCGQYSVSKGRDWGDFYDTRFSYISDKIIPLFKEYPIKGVKSKDFADFCEAARIIKQGRHLTEDGLVEINKIKNGMNKGRS